MNVRTIFASSLVFAATAVCFGVCLPLFAHAASGAPAAVNVSANSSIGDMLLQKVVASWPWYVTRASGLVAGLVLFIMLLSGMGFITGSTYSFLEPLTAWATHRALGIILVIALALHMLALPFDHFVPFNFWQLFVPFLSSYKQIAFFGLPLGSFFVALGIFAFYMVVAIVTVSLIWVNGKTPTWKLVHLMSYAVFILVFFHALFIGTDLAKGWLRLAWLFLGGVLLFMVLLRAWRAYTT